VELTGHHKREVSSIFKKIKCEHAGIEDLASTSESVMGIPVPPLDGKPLVGSLCIDKNLQIYDNEEQKLTPYEEWLLLQQMKTIGYWQ
jgi:hypothetical protein